MHGARVAVLVLALAGAVHAAQTPFVCGTSPRNDEQQQSLARWAAGQRQKAATALVLPSGYAKDGIGVVEANDLITPFSHPIDLTGKTLTFSRSGNETFSEATGALLFDEDRGAKLAVDTNRNAAYTIAGFDFPFFDRTVRTIHISQLHGIYPDTAPPLLPRADFQLTEAEWLAPARAVIAPLLTTQRGLFDGYPDIYLREAPDRIVVTWASEETSEAIQAVLMKSGDIVFSYRNRGYTHNGAVLITSGHEAWRTPVILGSGDDPANDTAAGMIDMTHVSAARLGQTNLLQFVFKLREPIDRTKITVPLSFVVSPGGATAVLYVYADPADDYVNLPGWTAQGPSPAVTVEGNTVTMTFTQEMIGAGSFFNTITMQTFIADGVTPADFAILHVTVGSAAQPAGSDFAHATTLPPIPGPIEETFTLPVLNAAEAFGEARGLFNIPYPGYDAVAIYQNFPTDIVFYAGAWSTGGNPGVDHIDAGGYSSSTSPLAPALMHMNLVGYDNNTTNESAAFLLMHELGHRWLFNVKFAGDDGVPTAVLNPVSHHPAQYVHTPAAFQVYTGRDSSVMGGSNFEDRGNGTFRTPDSPYVWGYSWLDLYLMGLATPQEVPPFFYLAGSQPVLGPEYNPPPAQSYTATRKNVALQQLLDVMGTRSPAYPATQRLFRVFFMILSDPNHPVTDDDLKAINGYRHLFEQNFFIATGGRGAVSTAFTPVPPHKRRIAP
jgi:hypothetical protein